METYRYTPAKGPLKGRVFDVSISNSDLLLPRGDEGWSEFYQRAGIDNLVRIEEVSPNGDVKCIGSPGVSRRGDAYNILVKSFIRRGIQGNPGHKSEIEPIEYSGQMELFSGVP